MCNLQTNSCSRLDFQKLDKYKGIKRSIHGSKQYKDNTLQSLYTNLIENKKKYKKEANDEILYQIF